MCGICGYWGNSEQINRAEMLRVLRHRGPDDTGEYEIATSSKPLWFGHQRLSIQDLSAAGHQPMRTADGQYIIVFNGEIYNFHEIRSELLAKGCHLRSGTDTEVILESWRIWGEDSLRRFRGMFAFALWSESDQTLWLARDRMGEKPLYYFDDGRRFLFASEVRALLASGVVPRVMDPDGLDAYLTFGSVADPYTLVRNVRAVDAGELVTVTQAQRNARTYWSLRDIPELPSEKDRNSLVLRVGSVLRESARLATVSDVRVAVLLSGGIDSSANVAMLSEQQTSRLHTFSVIFDGPDIKHSEEKWSSFVASRFGTQHNRIPITEDKARCWVPEAVAAMDQPSWDGVNTYLVCRAIAGAGIKVAISGQGSDELFLGYSQRNLFRFLLAGARLPLKRIEPILRQLQTRLIPDDSKYEKFLQIFGSDSAAAAAYLAQHSLFSQKGIERLLGSRRSPQTRFVRDQGGRTALGKLSRLELSHYLRNTLLRDGDQMSMANSIELRAPFVDYRLVEAVAATASSDRVTPKGRQKPLLVDAVGPNLPREVVNRPKQGFGLPYERWLRTGLEVADISSVDMGLAPEAVRKVKARFELGQYWSRYWCLQVLASWVTRERMSPP